MGWPWMRVESFFKAHLLRQYKERLERQADLTVAAIHANSSWDGEDNHGRKIERLKQIEESTAEAIAFLYSEDPEEDPDDPYSFENDPLFKDVRRMREEAQPPQMEQAGMGYELLNH